MLEVVELVAGYGKLEVLHGVSLHVAPGEIVCIIGANGAGKSTVLRSIYGLTAIRSGQIRFAGENVTGVKPHLVTRKGLGFVPQGRNIFPSLTVRENLELGTYAQGDGVVEERIQRVYDYFPLLQQRAGQKAGTLSGGERQMLAMGRALMARPRLLLLDEPSLGLAPRLVEHLFERIQAINAGGTPVLMVEQNARRALAISHRGYVLELGRNRFEGPGQKLLHDEQVRKLYLGG